MEDIRREFEERRMRWLKRPWGIVIFTQLERQGPANDERFREEAAAWIEAMPQAAERYRLVVGSAR